MVHCVDVPVTSTYFIKPQTVENLPSGTVVVLEEPKKTVD